MSTQPTDADMAPTPRTDAAFDALNRKTAGLLYIKAEMQNLECELNAAREHLALVSQTYAGDVAEQAARLATNENKIAALTYKSDQHTCCAVCGKDKHTPLRNDSMGGYVCLTCIDKELERVQAELAAAVNVKESAVAVLNAIELQAIAKEISVELGRDIGPAILPWIKDANKLLSFIDRVVPRADGTCAEAGITFTEACRRQMADNARSKDGT